jgi:hypothetical protein
MRSACSVDCSNCRAPTPDPQRKFTEANKINSSSYFHAKRSPVWSLRPLPVPRWEHSARGGRDFIKFAQHKCQNTRSCSICVCNPAIGRTRSAAPCKTVGKSRHIPNNSSQGDAPLSAIASVSRGEPANSRCCVFRDITYLYAACGVRPRAVCTRNEVRDGAVQVVR